MGFDEVEGVCKPVIEPAAAEVGTLARICLVGVLITAGACGGSAPSGPSAQFANMAGTWSGTLNINSGANICTYTWSIGTETGGTFSGSYQVGGSCRLGSGAVSGTVSAAGVLTFGPLLPLDSDCTRLAGGTSTGTVSGSAVSATASETLRCNLSSGPIEFTRSCVLSLARS
jgi:hypothetical protein